MENVQYFITFTVSRNHWDTQETIGARVWAKMHDVISFISLYWGAVWVHNGWQGNIREGNVCRAKFPLKADKKY